MPWRPKKLDSEDRGANYTLECEHKDPGQRLIYWVLASTPRGGKPDLAKIFKYLPGAVTPSS